MSQVGCPSVRRLVRLSGCPIIRQQQRRAADLLPNAVRTGDVDRQRRAPSSNRASSTGLSSKCGQCRVDSRRRRLKTDLLPSGSQRLRAINLTYRRLQLQ